MKTKRPYSTVRPIADKLLASFAPFCERLEVAGSLRRGSAEIGDIELVAIPKSYADLFGKRRADTHALADQLRKLNSISAITLTKCGVKYAQFEFTTAKRARYQVDLFMNPAPAAWGVNFLVRTGSAEFSRLMVTQRNRGGALPSDLRVKDARVWRDGVALETPTEAAYFELCGLPVIDPSERNKTVLQQHLAAVVA